MDDVEVIPVDVGMADDDIISVTCDDDLEDDESLESELREKFRIEREIKKEKIDNYPDFNVITTDLPGNKTIPSASQDSQKPTSKVDNPPDKVKEHGGIGVKKSLTASPEPKECISKAEVGEDKDCKKDSDRSKSRASDAVKKKDSTRCASLSSKPSADKSSIKLEAQKVDAIEARKRKQDTLRSVQRKKMFVPVDHGERSKVPGLEEKTEFLWRKMRRIQHQNRQLYQLVEKLCTQLNDRTLLNQAALNRVPEDCFSSTPLLAQGSLRNHDSIPSNSSTFPSWSNQGAFRDSRYPTQACGLNNRIVRRQLEEEGAVYCRPRDEYLTVGHENNQGIIGLLDNPERFSSVVPTYREDYCTPRTKVHHSAQDGTLVYPSRLAANLGQVVRNQMIPGPSRLEGRPSRRILRRETAPQHQQEQYRSLEASYQESCASDSYPSFYHESDLQRYEPLQKREIMEQPRSEVNCFEFDGQNDPVMEVMHKERVVRKRPILFQRKEYCLPLARGAQSMAHVTEMADSRDTRQVKHQRRLNPVDVRSVEVGSEHGTFNQLAVESLDHDRYWQGEQFCGRRD